METFSPEQIEALAGFVAADRFTTGASARELHRHDISPHRGTLPAGIVFPETTEEVSAILRWTYARELCEDCGATGFEIGVSDNERAALWRARHEAWETIHEQEHGAAYDLMRGIKRLIDPKGLMNPGKIFL